MDFTCCDQDAVWVENVPGKGYYFCKSCRNEVLAPMSVEEFGILNSWDASDFVGLDPMDLDNLTDDQLDYLSQVTKGIP